MIADNLKHFIRERTELTIFARILELSRDGVTVDFENLNLYHRVIFVAKILSNPSKITNFHLIISKSGTR